MKKTDIAMIILIATICVMSAFFITRAVMGDPKSEEVKVKTIEKITSEVTAPDTKVFNSEAINPAYKVEIDSTTNDTATQ